MKKPKLYKGLAYSFPEPGLMAFYVPGDDSGTKLYVLKLTPQTQPVAYLLKRLVDEATRPKWYERIWQHYHPLPPAPQIIDEKLGKSEVNEPKPKGRVVNIKKKPEYDPNASKRRGGKVVKTMPKQLKKIKEGQEATNANQ